MLLCVLPPLRRRDRHPQPGLPPRARQLVPRLSRSAALAPLPFASLRVLPQRALLQPQPLSRGAASLVGGHDGELLGFGLLVRFCDASFGGGGGHLQRFLESEEEPQARTKPSGLEASLRETEEGTAVQDGGRNAVLRPDVELPSSLHRVLLRGGEQEDGIRLGPQLGDPGGAGSGDSGGSAWCAVRGVGSVLRGLPI